MAQTVGRSDSQAATRYSPPHFTAAMSLASNDAEQRYEAAATMALTAAPAVGGEQPTACPSDLPEKLAGAPEWRLTRSAVSPTSRTGEGEVTDDEQRLIAMMTSQENDGIYANKMGQEGDVLVRLYCQSPKCPVKAKVIRYPGWLGLYTQHMHQQHDVTPKRGLKKPALRLVHENIEKPQQQLFQDLKRKGMHNKSWTVAKNTTAIKNAKQAFNNKRDSADEGGPFQNLQTLSATLDAHTQSVESFLSPPASTESSTPRSEDTSPFRNIIVLRHDVTLDNNGSKDWTEIVVTFPSARNALQKARFLWKTGNVQQEIDYSKGFWINDLRQAGMVGFSDADRVFHPSIISIQNSEDGPGSNVILASSTDMISQSRAVPDTCLKDGSEALRYAAKMSQLIPTDCFAHMTRLPFTRGGGIRGSRGSLSRYLLTCKDNTTGKRLYIFRDVCDVLSFVFAFAHLPSLPDWITARRLFMEENQDLPLHVYNQYLPIYPRWGSACHRPGEARSSQGLEKTWDHLTKKKNYYQKTCRSGDLEAILQAISQTEELHANRDFATVPTIEKQHWDTLSEYHSLEAGMDLKSGAYYSQKDGRALTRQEAIGNARDIGGYVVYLPNDAFSNEWKDEAVKNIVGGDDSTGMTMQQIMLLRKTAKDKSCISSRSTEVKVSFMAIVGANLRKNTPTPHEGEDCRSFLMRRAHRDVSVNDWVQKPNKKRKKTVDNDRHQQELENKKWATDVEAAFTSDVQKKLPKDPNDDNDEESEVRAWLDEHGKSKQETQQKGSDGDASKKRRERVCGRACGHFKEVLVTETGTISCNCEDHMTNGWCLDTLVFGLVEFNVMPSIECRDVNGISWEKIRGGWKKRLMSTLFSGPNEEKHAKTMHDTYLPGRDPLFGYKSIVHSVPVPWMRIDSDPRKKLTLGVRFQEVGTEQGNLQAKIIAVDPRARAKVRVGDVIVKVNSTTFASDNGVLLTGKTASDIVAAINQSPKDQIMTMDVLRPYRSRHVVVLARDSRLPTTGEAVANWKTTGLDTNN